MLKLSKVRTPTTTECSFTCSLYSAVKNGGQGRKGPGWKEGKTGENRGRKEKREKGRERKRDRGKKEREGRF